MDKLPFETQGLEDSDIQLLLDTYNLLKAMYPIKYDIDFTYNLKDLEVLADYKRADIIAPFDIVNCNKSYITFTEVEYTYRGGPRGSDREAIEYQAWGITKLSRNFGHIIIRPETIIDKIQEIFGHHKVDFKEDEAFNNKFYVLAADKEMAGIDLNDSFRELMVNFEVKDFVIEILNNHLIIGNKQPMVPKQTCYFAEFVKNVTL